MNEESIDLSEFVDVVVVDDLHSSMGAQYVNGCVFEKNLAEKRMPTKIERAKVLIVKDQFAHTEDEFCDLEEIIADRREFLLRLQRALNKLRPNVVLVEQHLSVEVIEELASRGIAAIANVEQIHHVARMLSGKAASVNSLLDLDCVLGSCDFEAVKEQCKDSPVKRSSHPSFENTHRSNFESRKTDVHLRPRSSTLQEKA